MIQSIVKIAGFSIAALIIGFFAMTLFFSDLGPDEALFNRFVIAFILYFAIGFIIGFFNPDVWMLSALVSWGGVMLGAVSLATLEDPALSILMVIFSLLPSLLGGFLASRASKRLLKRKNS